MSDKRNAAIYFKLSSKELDLIHQKMAMMGTSNISAYLRKMAIDGYIINLDMKEFKEISRLLRITSNNVNQMAKRANETGNLYEADIIDVKDQLYIVKEDFGKILQSLTKF